MTQRSASMCQMLPALRLSESSLFDRLGILPL
jgi:hypothetical protein